MILESGVPLGQQQQQQQQPSCNLTFRELPRTQANSYNETNNYLLTYQKISQIASLPSSSVLLVTYLASDFAFTLLTCLRRIKEDFVEKALETTISSTSPQANYSKGNNKVGYVPWTMLPT